MKSLQEFTVLLVDPKTLPAKLEESLVMRSCFVETTEAGKLSGTLLVSTPDLIIAAQEHLDEACRCVRAAGKALCLMLIAPRGSLSNFRLRTPPEVNTVVPFDMPTTAIAVRAQTLLKRALEDAGKSQELPSAPVAVEVRLDADPGDALRLGDGASPRLLSLPSKRPAPLGPAPISPPSHVGAPKFVRPERSNAAFAQTIAGARALEEIVTPAQSAQEEEPYIPAALRPFPSTGQRPATQKVTTDPKFVETTDLEKSPSGTRRVNEHPAPQPAIDAKPSPERRVSLEMPAAALPGLRVALLDEDVTRADAVSTALREAGHKVFLVSNTSGVTRWALLRRFSPQVVLVDEQSLARDGGQWLSQFRADAFLRATALVASPLGDVFDPKTGVANLSPLTPQLEGIARVEMAFVAQLSPRREVVASARQLNPARLLSILAELGKSAHLEGMTDTRRLSFDVCEGHLGRGHLSEVSAEGDLVGAPAGLLPEIYLEPARVLDFLLEHPDLTVVVQEAPETTLTGGRMLSVLLESAFEENLPEPVVQMVARSMPPPSFRGSERSVRPAPLPTPRFEDETLPDSQLPTMPFHLDQLPVSKSQLLPSRHQPAQLAPHASLRAVQSARSPFQEHQAFEEHPAVDSPNPESPDPSHREEVLRPTPEGFARFIPAEVAATMRSQKGRLIAGSAAALGLVGVLGAASLWGGAVSSRGSAVSSQGEVENGPNPAARETGAEESLSASSQPPSTRAQVEELPTGNLKDPGKATPAKHVPSPEESTAQSDSGDSDWASLYRIEGKKDLTSCEKLLEQPLSFYQEKPRYEGQALWKRARHQLLMGETEMSQKLMCQAAFVDPSGPASVGLGSYYLAQRSLDEAHKWALYGIEQRPDFPRKSQELLGDVLSQMGKVEEARAVWLETMNLDRDDEAKLRGVARTLTSSAAQAKKGGDYPLAERLLRRATTFDEGNAQATDELAVALLKNSQPRLAGKWAARALSLNANSSAGLYVLGELSFAQGDEAEARRNFAQVPRQSAYSKEALERLEGLGGP